MTAAALPAARQPTSPSSTRIPLAPSPASTPAPCLARPSGVLCTAVRANACPVSRGVPDRAGLHRQQYSGLRAAAARKERHMPTAQVNGAAIYYEEAGSGFPLLLSPGGLQGVLASYQSVSKALSQAY